ncbi:response regulator [Wenyingzhuangia sp. IMCC45533]
MIKVLIADDHPLMANGIKDSIADQSHISVVGICSNGHEVLNYIKNNKVDVLLLDIEMPVMNGIECAEKLLEKYIHLKILILSMYQEPSVVNMVKKIGVHGYLLKTTPKCGLINTINKIFKGEKKFDQHLNLPSRENVLDYIDSEKAILEELSKRETEILTHLSKGFTNKEIGDHLSISARTVDTHRTNLMRKLNIHNIAGLIRFAFKVGLN